MGGIAVDAAGNLLVYAGPHILEFRRGASVPFRVLEAVSGGFGVAVNASGTVYAGGPDNAIRIYDHGAPIPTRTVRDPIMTQIHAVAVSRSGTIFCNGTEIIGSSGYFPLDELRPHAVVPTRLRYLDAYGGLGIGKDDTLVVQDSLETTISVYARPYTGSPVSEFTYGGELALSDMALTMGRRYRWIIGATKNRDAIFGQRFSLARSAGSNQTPNIGGGYDGNNAIAVDPPALR